MNWFERIFRRRQLRDEVAEELREHVEEKTEQLMRLENLSRTEARQAALRAFGNLALVETRSREVWQWPRLESVLADLKLAMRRMIKSPGFATTVLLTLAIGIGANTAVFSVVNRVLLAPLPYPDADRLVSLLAQRTGRGGIGKLSEGSTALCLDVLYVQRIQPELFNHWGYGLQTRPMSPGWRGLKKSVSSL
jgi:hypothetical protein